MMRRWGLQAAMTATYVAVTAGAVLLTELVIFGAAALSPPAPLTPAQVQGLAQTTAAGQAAKLAVSVTSAGALPSTNIGLPGSPVTPGQAQPDDSGGLTIPYTADPVCDLAAASFAVVVSRDGTVLATSYPACFPVGSHGSDAQAGVPRKVLTFVRWPALGSELAPLPGGAVAWASAPITLTQPGQLKATTVVRPGSPTPDPSGSPAASSGKVFGMLSRMTGTSCLR